MDEIVEEAVIYMEVDGIAEDELGNPAPAGVRFSLGKMKAPMSYGDMLENIHMNIEGFLKLTCLDSIATPDDVRFISPSYYSEHYGEEDNEDDEDITDEVMEYLDNN